MRVRRGVRSGGRCVKPTRRNRTGRRCTYYTKVGSFTHIDVAGRNRFHFTGRVRGRKLALGTYQLVATPRANGLAGAPKRVTFHITR
jgi:hypothetical protein